MTEEVPAVGMMEEAAVGMPKEVVAPADVPEVAAPADVGSEEVVPKAVLAAVAPPAAGMVEDDSWYVSMQDFVHLEAEGEAGTPPDFSRVHIPCDEVQASGPRRDAARAEFVVAALATRGQVIILSIQNLLSYLT